uniref:Uncharacterized protein n=1 Tax=Vitis vinifera TaxID=29760 RepID=F6HSC9_VITVI
MSRVHQTKPKKSKFRTLFRKEGKE